MKKLISVVLIIATIFSLMAGMSFSSNADNVNALNIKTDGTWYSSNISESSKIKWFKIVLPSDGFFTIKILHYMGCDLSIYKDEDLSIQIGVHSMTSGDVNSPNTDTFSYDLSKAVYYIKVNQLYGRYNYGNFKLCCTFKSFGTTEQEPNNFDTANLLLQNKALIGALTVTDDVDWYKFNVPFSATIQIKLMHYMPCDLGLYNSDLSETVLYKSFTEGSSETPATFSEKNTLKSGTYYLKVTRLYGRYNSGKYQISWDLKVDISKPSGLKPTVRKTNAQKVSWNKVAGVSGYQVQCSDGGSKWAQTKNVTANSASFSGLTAGGKYKFRVRAYKVIDGTKYYSARSSTLCSCAKPATVTIKGVSSPKHTQIKTTWAKAGGVVSGYQILYGKNASFSSIAARKNVSGKSTVSYTGKNFTKGRTYYVKVRTYTVFNGVTYYGAWSAAKKVKCK